MEEADRTAGPRGCPEGFWEIQEGFIAEAAFKLDLERKGHERPSVDER